MPQDEDLNLVGRIGVARSTIQLSSFATNW
jgi:hypothetical protein